MTTNDSTPKLDGGSTRGSSPPADGSSDYHLGTVVIGAGAIGLAVGRALAMHGDDVWVIEQECETGQHTSTRNSEVIHAGIYYPSNSLKARHCVTGKQMLYEYCESHNVPFKRCGKLIVATGEPQLDQLKRIHQQATSNNVLDLQLLNSDQVTEMEPELHSAGALLSPSTGIFDVHSYLLALEGDIERHGGQVLKQGRCVGGQVGRGAQQHTLCIENQDQQLLVSAKRVINCGGLFAAQLLRLIEGFPQAHIPPVRFAKGNYFALASPCPFNHLIYPVPEEGGLGIHLTLDLGGRARFGPDVEWLKDLDLRHIDYRVDEARQGSFYQAIRRYWPNLPDGSLHADYSGIRPKLMTAEGQQTDFLIQGANTHGISQWINLLGIESPGLTSSLSLAQAVCSIMRADNTQR